MEQSQLWTFLCKHPTLAVRSHSAVLLWHSTPADPHLKLVLQTHEGYANALVLRDALGKTLPVHVRRAPCCGYCIPSRGLVRPHLPALWTLMLRDGFCAARCCCALRLPSSDLSLRSSKAILSQHALLCRPRILRSGASRLLETSFLFCFRRVKLRLLTCGKFQAFMTPRSKPSVCTFAGVYSHDRACKALCKALP